MQADDGSVSADERTPGSTGACSPRRVSRLQAVSSPWQSVTLHSIDATSRVPPQRGCRVGGPDSLHLSSPEDGLWHGHAGALAKAENSSPKSLQPIHLGSQFSLMAWWRINGVGAEGATAARRVSTWRRFTKPFKRNDLRVMSAGRQYCLTFPKRPDIRHGVGYSTRWHTSHRPAIAQFAPEYQSFARNSSVAGPRKSEAELAIQAANEKRARGN